MRTLGGPTAVVVLLFELLVLQHPWEANSSRRRCMAFSLQPSLRMTVCDNHIIDPLWNDIPSNVVQRFFPDDTNNRSMRVLEYPYWYEPHSIAQWASQQLQDYLLTIPETHQQQQQIQHSPTITTTATERIIGKMFGILVVERNEPQTQQAPNNTARNTPFTSQVGYLQAYSGTMPGWTSQQSYDYGFVPLVYDRWSTTTSQRLDNKGNDSDDDFSYAQREEYINTLNLVIDKLETCPILQQRQYHLQVIQRQVQSRWIAAKRLQKLQKLHRQTIRKRAQSNMSPQDYQQLEEDLLQQGAAIQRQLKALKQTGREKVTKAQQDVDDLEQLISTFKQHRKQASAQLQQDLFERYQFLNGKGQTASLITLFQETPLQRPPSGAGDCAAPKLFQYAFQNNYRPIALAEFWWGPSPLTDLRQHGLYYPCCRGKCQPILQHMLQGVPVQHQDPLFTRHAPNTTSTTTSLPPLKIVYEDDFMIVVNKPQNVLSVPGKTVRESIYTQLQQRYPHATGPLLVHRLDLSTSGLLVAAKTLEIHKTLQAQFIQRTIEKRYTALLDGPYDSSFQRNTNHQSLSNAAKFHDRINCYISLPLSSDYLNRPMQKVDFETGKPALTRYQILNVNERGQTRVYLYPKTGRTHQLRVHAAHPWGLGLSIVGDDIYGKRADRLYLHAGWLQLVHPISNQTMTFSIPDPF